MKRFATALLVALTLLATPAISMASDTKFILLDLGSIRGYLGDSCFSHWSKDLCDDYKRDYRQYRRNERAAELRRREYDNHRHDSYRHRQSPPRPRYRHRRHNW